VAVSTGGSSPALAARVARDLKAAYRGYGALCRLLARARALVLAADLDEETRKRIFKALAEDPELGALVASGEVVPLRERLKRLLEPVTAPEDFP
jgi:siroheme synthase (precorrin-2 oxidase/ferrochelatase)